MKVAIFPGSFDPFTVGHASIVERGLPMFDRIVIGVGVNDKKRFYKVGGSQNLIMPNWKSEALACHLLRTSIMFFLY